MYSHWHSVGMYSVGMHLIFGSACKCTCGFISSEDSLARRDNPQSNIIELFLLLRAEEWVCVRHCDCKRVKERERKQER